MTIVIGIVIFILMGAFTRSYPAIAFLSMVAGIGICVYFEVIESLVDTKSGWLIALFAGFALGLISRFIDRDEPQPQ